MSLRSIHTHRFGAGEFDAFDMRGAGKPGDVLRQCAPLHHLLQVRSDPVGHQFERQAAAFVLAIQPDDMEAITGCDRLRCDCARLKRKQRPFEFGGSLARGDLAEIAALRGRRACRMCRRQCGQLTLIFAQNRKCRLGGRAGLSVACGIGYIGREEYVRCFVDVGCAKTLQILLIEAPAGRSVGAR